jgi:hypothetical protein
MSKLVYVAIDDTDNAESRGTGSVARELAAQLQKLGLVRKLGVTRHQLLVDPRIPYTSHNSSACIAIEVEDATDPEALAKAAAVFLAKEAAPGSDPGLCVAEASQVTPEIIDFGKRAKREVLAIEEAHSMAEAAGIHLSGHTGERIGVIGTLAAVGLHHTGEDGRFLELNGVYKLEGRMTAAMLQTIGIESFQTEYGHAVPEPDALVAIGEGTKPILRRGRPTLLIEKIEATEAPTPWQAASKERIKQFSN